MPGSLASTGRHASDYAWCYWQSEYAQHLLHAELVVAKPAALVGRVYLRSTSGCSPASCCGAVHSPAHLVLYVPMFALCTW